jgi:large subunit ribosomal protein L17
VIEAAAHDDAHAAIPHGEPHPVLEAGHVEAAAMLADVSHAAPTNIPYAEPHPVIEAAHQAAAVQLPALSKDEAEAKFAAAVTTLPPTLQPSAEPAAVIDAPTEPPSGKLTMGAADVHRDDLKKIEGIGPKIAEALNNAGVLTFAQLARLQPAEIEKIVRDAGVRMIGHGETWPVQADLAAAGKWGELKALQAQFEGGRRSS